MSDSPSTPASTSSGGDLSRLRIHRDESRPTRLRSLTPWIIRGAVIVAAAVAYPAVNGYLAARRMPEVEVARAARLVTGGGASSAIPVLAASGYVIARRSAAQRKIQSGNPTFSSATSGR